MSALSWAGPPRALAEPAWQQAEREHAARVDGWTAGHRERARRGVAHPVQDFLFTYYSFRPNQLRRWHPGAGRALQGDPARARLGWRWYAPVHAVGDDGSGVDAVGLDVAAFVADRGEALRFVRDLLAASAARPPFLGCFGLHEWAMTYRLAPDERRHGPWPLRLGSAGTDAVVERHRIRCSHFDAFRFFTPAAAPRNQLQPRRSTQVALEQPGCLHATMDLYKWAYKLSPAVPGEELADCFALARDVRVLDMRASPYDLSALGYDPVPVETPEGKAAYVKAQRGFGERADVLRRRLLEVCAVLLGAT